MAFSCQGPSVDKDPSFLITYDILNKDGAKTTTVNQGENFVFTLMITNTSDEDWYIDHQSIIGSNFTEIFKKSNSGQDSLVGQAYISAMCTFQSGDVIPAKGTYQIDIPWIADKSLTKVPSCSLLTKDNGYLPTGLYVTKINQAINVFRSDITRKIPLNEYNIAFQIQ